VSRGQVLPTEDRFDSNCITPGTEFMWKLHKQLKYFVHQKTTNDPLWQRVTVILSGQDVSEFVPQFLISTVYLASCMVLSCSANVVPLDQSSQALKYSIYV